MTPTSIFSYNIRRYLERNGLTRMRPKAALIDMDGTLYDSMPGHTAAWHRMITELGIEATREEFYLYEGMTGAATIDLIFNRAFNRDATPEEKEKYYAIKTRYFKEQYTAPLMSGASGMLEAFTSTGMKCVLVTGSGQASLIDRVRHDFPDTFGEGMFVTSRDVIHGKPHPEPFLQGMDKAGVKPSQSIVMENAPLGVEAGHASGAFTIGVTTGPIPRKTLEDAGADIVFNTMEECAVTLPLLLMDLNNFKND